MSSVEYDALVEFFRIAFGSVALGACIGLLVIGAVEQRKRERRFRRRAQATAKRGKRKRG